MLPKLAIYPAIMYEHMTLNKLCGLETYVLEFDRGSVEPKT
jgi:hypothetical protein